MRRPTSPEDRWRWWESAIAGETPPRDVNDDPPCGFFKVRKFRWAAWPSPNAPWVPARIWARPAQIDEAGELLEPEILIAEIDGRRFNPWLNDSWMYWVPITEAEWKWLTAISPLTANTIPQRAKNRQSKR